MRWTPALGLMAPVALLLLHCGTSSPSANDDPVALPSRTTPDAATDAPAADAADAAPDTPAAACDPTKPFGAPVRIADFDAASANTSPRLSPDELTMYFTTTTATTNSDLMMAARATNTAPFGSVVRLPQSTAGAENDPMASADGLTLWFHSIRNGSADLFFATRASTGVDFGAAALVPTVNQGNTIEANAYFRGSASELWFVSERMGSELLDIYVSRRTGLTFDTPTRIAELSSASDEFLPQPSEDGLTVIFASNRPGGQGNDDLWIAHRASDTALWDSPAPLTELNSASTDQPGWLSADGCRIWFSSGRETSNTTQQLFYAERPR
jgi:Tol biopolymer transport system component